MLAAIAVVLVLFVYRAFVPPRVVLETSSRWPITGQLHRWTDNPATMGQVLMETATAIFTRTEKGFPPDLADFVSPDLLEALSNMRPREAGQAGFSQSFSMTDLRPVGFNDSLAIVRYRGVMTVTTQQRHAVSDISFECSYTRKQPTDRNALGWRLNDVREMTESEFFDPERKAVRDQKFNPGNLPSMTQAKTAAK